MSPSPAPAGPHAAPAKFHPSAYLRTLYKRRWIAIPGFLLVFLSGALTSLRTVPIYEAHTQLLIEKSARRSTSINTVLQEQPSWYADEFYPTQYKILQSKTLAVRTVEALQTNGVVEYIPASPSFDFSVTGLVGTAMSRIQAWMKRASAAPPQDTARVESDEAGSALSSKADAFRGSLIVSPIPKSLLVDLKVRSTDPVYAARAANELADQYTKQSVRIRADGSKEINTYLQAQLEEQKRATDASERKLQEFKESHRTVSVDSRQSVAVEKLTAIQSKYLEARLDRANREVEFNQLKSLRDKGMAESFPAVMSNAFVQGLKSERAALDKERTKLASSFGENAPPMTANKRSIDAIDAKLVVEIEKVAQGVESAFTAAVAREQDLQRAVDSQKNESIGADRTQMEYAALEREAAGNRELHQNLLQHSKESTVSSEFQGSNIQIVDKAEVPSYPVLPQTRRDLMTAAFFGLMLALGLAFGAEYLDSRIRLPDEIKNHLGLPVLGMIPAVIGADAGGEAPMLSGDVPASFSESMRSVRTALLFSSADNGARAVMVTSTGPGEGKTLVASSLAVTLAQAGLRTLVIDADMRRPRMHEALGRPQEPGLSNVLVGDIPVSQAAAATQVENLWLLAAGHVPPNPAELIGSPKFNELFAGLKQKYDWIVIDAPPVMPVTDAAVLAHTNVGVLFVVGSEMTTRQSAAAAVEQLRGSGARFVGGVLNRVNIHRHSYYYAPYYRKEYGTYYQRSANRA